MSKKTRLDPVTAECALCKTVQELKKSHIVPRFHFKKLYGKNVVLMSPDAKVPVVPFKPSADEGKERLLCSTCEGHFEKWETYASQVIFGEHSELFARIGPHPILSGIDYTKFKLFLLSLLWRMSVAKGPLWKDVQLGPHEELMRNMLLKSDPGESTDYPCILNLLTFEGEHDSEWIVPPTPLKYPAKSRKYNSYGFVLNGILFTFLVTTDKTLDAAKVCINESNQLCLLLSEATNFNYLRKMFVRMVQVDEERNSPS